MSAPVFTPTTPKKHHQCDHIRKIWDSFNFNIIYFLLSTNNHKIRKQLDLGNLMSILIALDLIFSMLICKLSLLCLKVLKKSKSQIFLIIITNIDNFNGSFPYHDSNFLAWWKVSSCILTTDQYTNDCPHQHCFITYEYSHYYQYLFWVQVVKQPTHHIWHVFFQNLDWTPWQLRSGSKQASDTRSTILKMIWNKYNYDRIFFEYNYNILAHCLNTIQLD